MCAWVQAAGEQTRTAHTGECVSENMAQRQPPYMPRGELEVSVPLANRVVIRIACKKVVDHGVLVEV